VAATELRLLLLFLFFGREFLASPRFPWRSAFRIRADGQVGEFLERRIGVDWMMEARDDGGCPPDMLSP